MKETNKPEGEPVMKQFRKKPIVIEAVQYTEYGKLVKGMCNSRSCYTLGNTEPHVHTIHNNQVVNLEVGDFIIPEPDGEHYYPCKANIFHATYEPVKPEPVIGERSAEEILLEHGLIRKREGYMAFELCDDITFDALICAIDEYASQFRPKSSTLQEWISVKERLPEGEGDVLLLTTSQAYSIGDWYNGGWRTQNDTWDERRGWEPAYQIDDITHWQPLTLPSPPKQEQ